MCIHTSYLNDLAIGKKALTKQRNLQKFIKNKIGTIYFVDKSFYKINKNINASMLFQ